MSESLVKLAEEDPTFRVRQDEVTGQPLFPVWVSCIWMFW